MTARHLPLPNAGNAVVSESKLREYLLNPDHPQGRHKARVFVSALGISQDAWEYLRRSILDGIRVSPAVLKAATAWGDRYEVVIRMEGPSGKRAIVVTGWIIRAKDRRPSLVTAYVRLPRRSADGAY